MSTEEIFFIHMFAIDYYFEDYENETDMSQEQRGIMSVSGFESAVYLPQQTYNGKDLYPTTLLKASALVRSIIKNHPFYNANKRTGILALIMFMEYNHYEFIGTQNHLKQLALAIAKSNPPISVERLARHIDKRFRYIPPQPPSDTKKAITSFRRLINMFRKRKYNVQIEKDSIEISPEKK